MRIIAILALYLIGLTEVAAHEPRHLAQRKKKRGGGAVPYGRCDSDLLRSFSMFGRPYARMTALRLCPRVNMSCCTLQDQVSIFSNWVSDNEEASLSAKFNNQTNFVNAFFDLAEKVTDAAAVMLKKTSAMKTNECKQMARHILTYQAPDVRQTLVDGFVQTFNFLQETNKGLYCSLCDASSMVHFDSGSSTLTVSEEFCRSVVTNTVTSLQYLRIHLPNFINLVATFAGSCDYNARFKKTTIPTGVIQQVDATDSKVLTSCFKGRNAPSWLTTCQSICQKWLPGMITPYFLPDLNQIGAAINYTTVALANITAPGVTAERSLADNPRKRTKRLQKDRGLQLGDQPGLNRDPNLNNTYRPPVVDEYGYAVDYNNFTANGTNRSAILVLIEHEMNATKGRPALPLNLTTNVVYLSQDTSNVTSFSEWTVQVSEKGANFYMAAKYSLIDTETVESLYDPEVMGKSALKPPAQNRKLKHKQKLAGGASLASIAASFILVFLTLIKK